MYAAIYWAEKVCMGRVGLKVMVLCMPHLCVRVLA